MDNELDSIIPDEIAIKYNYIKVNSNYISTLYMNSIPKDIKVKDILCLQNTLNNSVISIYVKKINKIEMLKRLTEIIATNKSEIDIKSKNQQDVDIIDYQIIEAKELRKRIQIDNEDIYSLNIYISIIEGNESKVLLEQKKIENILYSTGFVFKPLNFRQKQGYLFSIPILYEDKIIFSVSSKIMPETTLGYILPLYNENTLNKEDIIIGKTNNTLCSINLLDVKNYNYNMCVFGSSGTGKSFFIKSLIIKNLYKGINQIVIDPEGEYSGIIKDLGGVIKHSYARKIKVEINTENENMIDEAVEEIINYINFKEKLTDEEESDIRRLIELNCNELIKNLEKIIKKLKEDSIITNTKRKNIFRNQIIELIIYQEKLKNSIKETLISLKEIKELFFDKRIICYDLSIYKNQELANQVIKILNILQDSILPNTLIYIDEFWKCIYSGKSENACYKIHEMYKTIRKKTAGIICATQDISDILNSNLEFGKSMINNSYFKIYFRMELIEREIFEKIGILDVEKLTLIRNLERGNAYIIAGNTSFKVEIIVPNFEKEMIEGRKSEKNSNSG